MLRAVLVDDDLLSINNLRYLCRKLGNVEVTASFQDAISALEYLKKNPADILFLDVEMPDFSGMELARLGRNLPPIVFTSAKSEYALEAFEQQALDYIQKPVTLSRLNQAVDKWFRTSRASADKENFQDYVFIKVDGKLLKVNYPDIMFIESTGDYVTFVMVDGKRYVTLSTMKSLETKMNRSDLLRVHRSYIINLRHVRGIEDTAVMVGDYVIPLSRTHKAVLFGKIKTL